MELLENDEYLKELENIDWDEDWSDVQNICGGPDIVYVVCICLREVNTGDTMSESNEPVSFDQNITAKRRFPVHVTQAEDLERGIVERVPKNTKKSTNWG